MMRALIASALMLSITLPVNAEIREARMLVADSKTNLRDLSDRLGLRKDTTTGFNILTSSSIWAAGDPVDAAPYTTTGIAVLKQGQYMIACFQPMKDMRVRLVDVNPKGNAAQIWPRQNRSVAISGGVKYCIGSTDSAMTLKTPRMRGLGKFYIIGAEEGEPPSPVSIPGSKENKGRGISETVIRYRIDVN